MLPIFFSIAHLPLKCGLNYRFILHLLGPSQRCRQLDVGLAIPTKQKSPNGHLVGFPDNGNVDFVD